MRLIHPNPVTLQAKESYLVALAAYQAGVRTRKAMILRLLQNIAMDEIEEARGVHLAADAVVRALFGGNRDDQAIRDLCVRDDGMLALLAHVRDTLADASTTAQIDFLSALERDAQSNDGGRFQMRQAAS
jgi:hypothetical protein